MTYKSKPIAKPRYIVVRHYNPLAALVRVALIVGLIVAVMGVIDLYRDFTTDTGINQNASQDGKPQLEQEYDMQYQAEQGNVLVYSGGEETVTNSNETVYSC